MQNEKGECWHTPLFLIDEVTLERKTHDLVFIQTPMGQREGFEPPKEVRPHFNTVAIYGLYQFAYLCMCGESSPQFTDYCTG